MIPVYPATWKICTPETAEIGCIIPLRFIGDEIPEACPNCGQPPPGSMFGFLIDDGGLATKYFRIGTEGKIFRGRMITAPCPRCGNPDRAPESDGGNSKAHYWDN
jgi:ribosomal protein S27AE